MQTGSCSSAFQRQQDRVTVGLEEVVRALPERSALVAFARYRDRETGTAPPASGASGSSYAALVWSAAEQEVVFLPLGSTAEIDLLVERYGVRNIKIIDELFVLKRDRVERLLDETFLGADESDACVDEGEQGNDQER